MSDIPSAPIFSAPEMPVSTAPQVSVWSRIANVIAAPADAFGGILAIEKKASLWLIPMLISMLVTVGFATVVMNNPALKQKMRQQMVEKFDEQVRAGKITQDQADSMLETMGGVTVAFGIIGGALAVPLMYLLMALVFFMIVSFVLGGEVSFINVFVVVALASIISMLETVVTGLMQYATADMYTAPNLGMLVAAKDNAYLHAALSRINPFSFWWLYVLCVGFAKISTVNLRKIMVGVGGAWVVWSIGAIAMAGMSFFQQWQK